MVKRILIVMTTPLCFDGISAMVLNYFKQFDKNQFQYEFAHWNDVPDAIKNDIESRGGVLHKLPVRVKKPFQYYIALKRLIKERHYSIVHAHGNSSTLYIEMLAAKHAGVQIRISHSHNSMCSYVLLHKLLKPLFHKSYTNAFTCSKKDGYFEGEKYIVTYAFGHLMRLYDAKEYNEEWGNSIINRTL